MILSKILLTLLAAHSKFNRIISTLLCGLLSFLRQIDAKVDGYESRDRGGEEEEWDGCRISPVDLL
jgi:hypothetical protein